MGLNKENPYNIKEYPYCWSGHEYARDIESGKIMASKYVKGAVARYFKDINNPDADFVFNPEKAERYLRLVQKFEHVIGEWKTKEIIYEPWQNFCWMNIMGFRNKGGSQTRRFRIAHIEVARGNGKALCPDTDIPTPDRGLIKFKEINPGDSVYGTDGAICKVVGKNELHTTPSYRVNFSDGTFVDCSENHLWVTSSKYERSRNLKSVKTTLNIFNSQKVGRETNHSIELAKPVEGSRRDCQLPYVLGYWLGDGDTRCGRFTAHVDQYEEIISRFKSNKLIPTDLGSKGKAVRFNIPALMYWLEELKVLNNKHIPEKYFMASEKTRRELLRGLMDSDGNVESGGRFTFCNTNLVLAKGVRRLIASLGYKPTLIKKKTSAQNGFRGFAYYVSFSTPNTRPTIFGIRAKEDKRTTRPVWYCNKRYITSVEKIEDRPMFCIEVDSPDKTFLITDQYIPTHNSAMASQALLFFLALDDVVQGNHISCVATKKDQARIVLDSARAMAKKSPKFLLEKGVAVREHSIVQKDTNSMAKALSARDDGLDGGAEILAVMDELHAMKRETFDVVYGGMSKRTDSLTLCITTAGFDMESVGYSQSEYAKKLCLGHVEDDQMFAIVYTLDEEDIKNDKNIFREEYWIKANPSYGASVDPITFKAKAKKAQETPADLPTFKVKHLNIWLSEYNSFYDLQKWDACADPTLKIEQFKNKKCREAADVASHIDLNSIAYIFKENDLYYIFDRSYIPEETVKRVRSSMYENCIGSGHLIQTQGEAVEQSILEEQMIQDKKDFQIQDLLLDPWNTLSMMQRLKKARLPVTEFRMNVANLSEPTKKLDQLIRQGKVRHNGSPLLRWCLGNVVVKFDAADNVFPRKSDERLKIDPIIAILMALASLLQDEAKEKIYADRGLRVL